MDALERSLIEAMAEWEIIDCHEHLGPERNRVASPVDVFTLFSHYTHRDLCVAGMSEADYQLLYWTHIISQRFAMDALDEAIDLVPMNKILAFGGDYGPPVEKVYGHLVMAREDVARILARRIERGQMTETQALSLAHGWFWENPKELYRLKVESRNDAKVPVTRDK